MFKIHVQNICNNVEREDFEKRTWYTCWYQELFKIKGVSKRVFYEGLRYKTLRFYDKAVTKHNYV